MRMFAAASPDNSSQRTAVPTDILRRLAFGRPKGRAVQPAIAVMPVVPVAPAVEAALPQRDDAIDLDQRVRQSGEW